MLRTLRSRSRSIILQYRVRAMRSAPDDGASHYFHEFTTLSLYWLLPEVGFHPLNW